MNAFLESLKYTVSTPDEGRKLEYFVIANRDGSPRWIIPAHAKRPLFLKFYHVGGLRSRLFAFISTVLFKFGLKAFAYKKSEVFIKSDAHQQNSVVDLWNHQWALFTGTAGPNNKMVLYTETESTSAFFKIPSTNQARAIVAREHTGTLRARAMNPAKFVVPATSVRENGILEIEDIAGRGKRSNQFSALHIGMLDEMYDKTAHSSETANSECFQSSMTRLNAAIATADSRIPASMFSRLQLLGSELEQTQMATALSHGDFTPWNMFVHDGAIAVYDWELATDANPIGFDAFHFIIQKGILIDRKPWREIRKEIDASAGSWLDSVSKRYSTSSEICLKQYLFVNISDHLELYSRQENWHEQINWLMATWSEALADVLANDQTARGLLIEDLFVHLNNKPYATIKFPELEPSTLDAYSDIDICLHKSDVNPLVESLKKHPLVSHVTVRKQSFMTSVQMMTKSGEVLNVDFIWQLKWKHLEMMSASEILGRAQTNSFGIKAMHPTDLVHYLGLFYGLNETAIPAKHHHYLTEVTTSDEQLTRLILTSHELSVVPKSKLLDEVSSMPSNNGSRIISNSIMYVLDTLKGIFGPKGMIITFSGVDGAGKSTIIEHVRKEFDKKLRRRVVVLRHRPSVLPILSAWTKGKAQAEQDAANTLPRMGTNQSFLGSLLRFAYYYTDYIAGQFVIYVRHVLRGDVVLYDRYYFDFINDSVRSNIRLPERFLRAGYFFLMKPDFNFFLYADADTILARKQELDKKTITELTTKYLALFHALDARKTSSSKYVPIVNNELDVTINQIMTITTQSAA
jgi:thymidylate kinase